jgi:hypothetical protein
MLGDVDSTMRLVDIDRIQMQAGHGSFMNIPCNSWGKMSVQMEHT